MKEFLKSLYGELSLELSHGRCSLHRNRIQVFVDKISTRKVIL